MPTGCEPKLPADQRQGSLGVGGREHRREREPVLGADEYGSLGPRPHPSRPGCRRSWPRATAAGCGRRCGRRRPCPVGRMPTRVRRTRGGGARRRDVPTPTRRRHSLPSRRSRGRRDHHRSPCRRCARRRPSSRIGSRASRQVVSARGWRPASRPEPALGAGRTAT
jgi:hypothetical protein